MRASRTEQEHADRLSMAVDQLLREPDLMPEGIDPSDAGVLATAQRLARLPALLGPVEPALERQVMSQVQSTSARVPRAARPKLGWAAAGFVAALLVMMLLTPLGQTAVAGFMAVFNLGRTEVRIEPIANPPAPATTGLVGATAVAGATAIQEGLTLEEAQGRVSYIIPQPTFLPPEYEFERVHGYTYPDLPAWVPQPFFLELVYGTGKGDELSLRVYAIRLGDEGSISELNLQATSIQDAKDVDVGGKAGVLLRLGTDRGGGSWQEVVWEKDELIMALSSAQLTEEELLRIARSVQ